MLGAFFVLTHLVLDLFQAPTPFLCPLLSQSLFVSVGLDLHISSSVIDHWFRCADLWEENDRVFLLIQ